MYDNFKLFIINVTCGTTYFQVTMSTWVLKVYSF
jgi:hypothetical protein